MRHVRKFLVVVMCCGSLLWVVHVGRKSLIRNKGETETGRFRRLRI